MVALSQWVIFGYGNYISDIADIIHASNDKISSIVSNIEPTKEQLSDLKRRISYFGYEVPIVELKDFKPGTNEKYFYGFFGSRDQVLPSLKKSYGITFSSLVHPTAYLGSNVQYGEGSIICPHAVIGPNCRIGDFTRINRASTIGHDTEIGEYSDIAPGVAVAGLVKIGRKTMIGIGATVIDGISIGSNSIVGAGAVAVKDLPDNVVAVGVPAKVVRSNE